MPIPKEARHTPAADGPSLPDVRSALGLDDTYLGWLEDLAAAFPAAPLRLPAPREAAARLRLLGVDPLDVEEAVGSLPRPASDPALLWLLERSVDRMRRRMGDVEADLSWPRLPVSMGAPGRFFLVHVFLAVLDDVESWHAAHGVDAATSRETLSALALDMRLRRQIHGEGGLFEHAWMTLPFRACLYALGRLQYTPLRLSEARVAQWVDPAEVPRVAPRILPDEPAVGIHIPESGPMPPAAVDASLARARAFFGRPQPWGPCRVAVCGSWLLDDQLAGCLPPTSNIVQFQRRFTLFARTHDADRSVLNFVFHRREAPASLDELPQRTTLERALVAHLKAGGHWRSRTGWLAL